MAKIIFQNEDLNINFEKKQGNTASASGFLNERDYLKKRSEGYMDMIKNLDTDMLSETRGKEEFMKKLHEEFGTADVLQLPIGILSKCFLEHPHDVHTLDLSQQMILKHYVIGEPLPPDFEKARNPALHNAYAFVEVYKDKFIIVHLDGTVTLILKALNAVGSAVNFLTGGDKK